MKRITFAVEVVFYLTLITFCLSSLLMCAKEPSKEDPIIQAQVLCIDSSTKKCQTIRMFLETTENSFSGEPLKVGVEFKFQDQLILRDILLNRAELLYYADQDFLPITVKKGADCSEGYNIYLNKRKVGKFNLGYVREGCFISTARKR